MKPQELNEIFNQFARAFVGTITSDREIALPHLLPREVLDGTLQSLLLVDEYLNHIHRQRATISMQEWDTTVLWGGAYVGEVVRHTREGEFEWIDYDEYMPRHPNLIPLIPERTVATCAFLLGPDGSMSMPLNKVARFIEEGPENSVHFFASCESSSPTPRSELSFRMLSLARGITTSCSSGCQAFRPSSLPSPSRCPAFHWRREFASAPPTWSRFLDFSSL